MLHQYRHPAGCASSSCRPACSTSRARTRSRRRERELQRGGRCVLAETWTHLFTTYSSPGLSSERIAYYLAQGLAPAPDRGGFEPAHEEADMTARVGAGRRAARGRCRDRPDHRRPDRPGAARLRAVPPLRRRTAGTSTPLSGVSRTVIHSRAAATTEWRSSQREEPCVDEGRRPEGSQEPRVPRGAHPDRGARARPARPRGVRRGGRRASARRSPTRSTSPRAPRCSTPPTTSGAPPTCPQGQGAGRRGVRPACARARRSSPTCTSPPTGR